MHLDRLGALVALFAEIERGCAPSQALAQPLLELDVVSPGAEQAEQGFLGLFEAARILAVSGRDAAVHEFAKVPERGLWTAELSVVDPGQLELELSPPLVEHLCPGVEGGELLLRRASPEIPSSKRQKDRAQAAQ